MSNNSFSSKTLRRFLEKVEVHAKFLSFREHTRTVDAAARQLGVSRKRIVKSLLFIDDRGSPVLAIVTGDRRVDESKLAAACNARNVRRASPSEVKAFTGYEIGAVPPVGHKTKMRTIMDERIFKFDEVIGGGGDVNTLLEISPLDIKKLTGAEVRDISR